MLSISPHIQCAKTIIMFSWQSLRLDSVFWIVKTKQTPKRKWVKGIWGQKSNKWYKRIPLEKRLQGLKALATIPCVLVKVSYITQPPGLYR